MPLRKCTIARHRVEKNRDVLRKAQQDKVRESLRVGEWESERVRVHVELWGEKEQICFKERYNRIDTHPH